MRVQITGSRGLLGSHLWRALAEDGFDTFLSSFDLGGVAPADVFAPLVVNCAGIVKQRDLPASRFAQVNAYGPHRLADACDAKGARLIHVSTDCVFGQIPGPHDESAIPCPEDLYAATKLAGEVIRAPHLTIRTSFVGPGERGLWHDIQQGLPQRASGKFLWSGHTAAFVAQVIVALAHRADITGLLHIPGEPIDRWDLVNTIAAHLGVELVVQRDDSYVRDRRLISQRYADLGLPRIGPFHQELAQFNQSIAAKAA